MVRQIFDKECWPVSMISRCFSIHRNTIGNWAKKTRKGEMNMPMIEAPGRMNKYFIPIADFRAWYRFEYQN